MDVKVGQRVYVPDPDGGRALLATVVALGEPDDAVEILVDGKPVRRDVAIIRYAEGEREGFTDSVRYELLSAIGSDPARRLTLTAEQFAYVNKRRAEGVPPPRALAELGIDLSRYDTSGPGPSDESEEGR